jgi:hypothetical protein
MACMAHPFDCAGRSDTHRGSCSWPSLAGLMAETNRTQLVLFGMQNRTSAPIWQPLIGSSFRYWLVSLSGLPSVASPPGQRCPSARQTPRWPWLPTGAGGLRGALLRSGRRRRRQAPAIRVHMLQHAQATKLSASVDDAREAAVRCPVGIWLRPVLVDLAWALQLMWSPSQALCRESAPLCRSTSGDFPRPRGKERDERRRRRGPQHKLFRPKI